ncbi:MAG TPA: MBL fold metallo-hydrolase [Acidimicrobiia bacterium]|nr:MBL fold metallo-hydrolase [Acidimicrobiia bacterium]
MVEIVPVPDPGLGNTSYLVDLGDGSGLVVDPERDPRPYLEEAKRHRLTIRHVAETHLHADFVSGSRELVALGASLIAPRASRLAHPHRAIGDGDRLEVGGLGLAVMVTPGHTPEHVSYVLYEETTPLVLFSGGTLMAGGVARPDLISPDLTVLLAQQAYQSVRRLLSTLPDQVEVRPTHGGGSFCSSAGAPPSGWSTIGAERRTHPAATAPDSDRFVTDLLAGLGTYPPYFHRLREVNRLGPRVYGVELPGLSPIRADELAGKAVIDARPIARFARGHIPGSVSIELRDQFGTWLGWLFEPATPLVFVLDADQDQRELVRQALNVGHEQIAGRVSVADWLASGADLAAIDLLPADLIGPDAAIVDVRQRSEWESGHVPGAIHLELGTLGRDTTRVDPGVVLYCGHGARAMTAASLLCRAGKAPAGVTTASHGDITRAVAGR